MPHKLTLALCSKRDTGIAKKLFIIMQDVAFVLENELEGRVSLNSKII